MSKPNNYYLKWLFIITLNLLCFHSAESQVIKMALKVRTTPGNLLCKIPDDIRFEIDIRGPIIFVGSGKDSVFAEIDFGDGSRGYFRNRIEPGGASSSMVLATIPFIHTYSIKGIYSPRIIVSTKLGGFRDTLYNPRIYVWDSCASVSGKIYLDDNSNCIPDIGEKGIAWIPVDCINTSSSDTFRSWKWSDTGGYYSIVLPSGTYDISPAWSRKKIAGYLIPEGDSLIATCPASGISSLSVGALSTHTMNFAYNCAPSTNLDLGIFTHVLGWAPGDTCLLNIVGSENWNFLKTNCEGRNTTITLTLDPKLTYIGHRNGVPPSSVSGSTITWALTDANISMFYSRLHVATSTTARLGDTVCNTSYIAPASGYPDPDMSNNTFNDCKLVRAAYDPNIKEVIPQGKGDEGYIPQFSPLIYTIHFQNTGNAPARNVIIHDTLESGIDPESFYFIGSSHTPEVYKTDSILSFCFRDIYLPDSSSDIYESMGFLSFGVLHKADLPLGSKIKNRAAIIFDYNEPIITNYTLNTLAKPNLIKGHKEICEAGILIFPNPTTEEINLWLESNSASIIVSLCDLTGRELFKKAYENIKSIKIPVQEIPAGLYLLKVQENRTKIYTKKVSIIH